VNRRRGNDLPPKDSFKMVGIVPLSLPQPPTYALSLPLFELALFVALTEIRR